MKNDAMTFIEQYNKKEYELVIFVYGNEFQYNYYLICFSDKMKNDHKDVYYCEHNGQYCTKSKCYDYLEIIFDDYNILKNTLSVFYVFQNARIILDIKEILEIT